MPPLRKINFSADEQKYLMERNRRWIEQFYKGYIVGLGFGYRTHNGKLTNELRIKLYVNKKVEKPKYSLPKFIAGIRTDVEETEIKFEFDKSPLQKIAKIFCPDTGRTLKRDQYDPYTSRIENVTLDPIVSGIPIRRSDKPTHDLASLGAIVFDSVTGAPFGLSVYHGIGKDSKGDDLIVQGAGESDSSSLGIGRLKHTDRNMDTAIFELSTKRNIHPKVRGLKEDFFVRDMIAPSVGMEVEFFGKENYASGVVTNIPRYANDAGSSFERLEILVDRGFNTGPGDSGGLWMQKDSHRPVGIHLGTKRGHSRIKISTSARDIAQRWQDDQKLPVKFQFTPVAKTSNVRNLLKNFEASFVERDSFLYAVCQNWGQDLEIRRFDREFKDKNRYHRFICKGLKPLSGVAVASFAIDPKKAPDIFGYWVGENQQIFTGRLSAGTTVIEDIQPIRRLQAFYKPAVTVWEDMLIIAFVDTKSRLVLGYSKDGVHWKTSPSGVFCKCAPAICVYKNKPVVSWVAFSPQGTLQMPVPRGRIKISYAKKEGQKLKLSGTASNVTPDNETAFDVSLCSDSERLYLAYTDAGNQVQIAEAQRLTQFANYRKIESYYPSCPTIYSFENEIICTRRE